LRSEPHCDESDLGLSAVAAAFFSPPASCRATETERKIVQCGGAETTRKREGGKKAEARGRERGSERGNVWGEEMIGNR